MKNIHAFTAGDLVDIYTARKQGTKFNVIANRLHCQENSVWNAYRILDGTLRRQYSPHRTTYKKAVKEIKKLNHDSQTLPYEPKETATQYATTNTDEGLFWETTKRPFDPYEALTQANKTYQEAVEAFITAVVDEKVAGVKKENEELKTALQAARKQNEDLRLVAEETKNSNWVDYLQKKFKPV